MAPETRGEFVRYDKSADVYAFAMVLYHMHSHRLPFAEFRDRDEFALERDIARFELRPTLPTNVAPAMRALIERCWKTTPTLRPTFAEIVVDHALTL